MKMVFDIKKIPDTHNIAKIEIFNLSQETRDKIEDMNIFVSISAGYEGNPLKLLFKGKFFHVVHKYDVPEIITTIEAKDVGPFNKNIDILTVAINIDGPTTMKNVIKNIIRETAYPTKNDILDTNAQDRNLATGYSNGGHLKQILDELTSGLGISWSLQDGAIQFLERGETFDQSATIILSEKTGLIGIPQKGNEEGIWNKRAFFKDNPKKRKQKAASQPFYLVESLLQPTAEIGGLVRVISQKANLDTEFTIDAIEHVGGNFDTQFITKFKLLHNVFSEPLSDLVGIAVV